VGRWYGGLLCPFPKAIGDVDKRSCALHVGVLRTNWPPLFAPRILCEKCCRCRNTRDKNSFFYLRLIVLGTVLPLQH